ncbi:hypothetical protein L7F22_021657 [Adiantum nelumboides]|nr:hypothetical protein [Adiantum nelumboides]
MDIVESRWAFMSRPIHGMAAVLHPLYKKPALFMDTSLSTLQTNYINKVFSEEEQLAIDAEFVSYMNSLGPSFVRAVATREEATKLSPCATYSLSGKAPFKIVEGDKKIPPILQTEDKIFEADKYVQNTDEAYRKIKLSLEKTQSKQKKAADRHGLELVFSLGEWTKFEPKLPIRRQKKAAAVKSEIGAAGEMDMSSELMKLVKQSQDDAAAQSARRSDIRAPTRVAFGSGTSVAGRAVAAFNKGGGGSGGNSGDRKSSKSLEVFKEGIKEAFYPAKVYDWFEERLEIQAIADDITSKYVPPHVNIFYCLGGIMLTCFLVQVATGFAMTFYHRSTVTEAFSSVQYTMSEVNFGRLIRSVHHWSASMMVSVGNSLAKRSHRASDI